MKYIPVSHRGEGRSKLLQVSYSYSELTYPDYFSLLFLELLKLSKFTKIVNCQRLRLSRFVNILSKIAKNRKKLSKLFLERVSEGSDWGHFSASRCKKSLFVSKISQF